MFMKVNKGKQREACNAPAHAWLRVLLQVPFSNMHLYFHCFQYLLFSKYSLSDFKYFDIYFCVQKLACLERATSILRTNQSWHSRAGSLWLAGGGGDFFQFLASDFANQHMLLQALSGWTTIRPPMSNLFFRKRRLFWRIFFSFGDFFIFWRKSSTLGKKKFLFLRQNSIFAKIFHFFGLNFFLFILKTELLLWG